jgi:DNA-binding LytR/AlgR family response regulator
VEGMDFIFVREDKRMKKIMLLDVQFIESIKDYVKIILSDKNVLSYLKISHLEKSLPASDFIRTHKSFIVNVNAITSYTATEIEISGTIIPIGRYYKQLVHQALEKLMI